MLEIYDELIMKIDKNRVYLNEPMKNHTSFKIGGPADVFIKVKNIEELKYAINLLKKNNIKLYIIGNGTNILVKDGGIRGAVIKLDFEEINFISSTQISLGAGVLLSKIAKISYEKGLSGLEFANRNTRYYRWSNKNECRSIWSRDKGYTDFYDIFRWEFTTSYNQQ